MKPKKHKLIEVYWSIKIARIINQKNVQRNIKEAFLDFITTGETKIKIK